MGILKYSFARIPLSHAELVIRSAAELVIGEGNAQTIALPSTAIGSPPLKSTPLLGPQRTTASATPAFRRSRSRDARPLLDGYSYYGLETISPSPGSLETSPSATPRSTKLVSIDALASQLHASASASASSAPTKALQCRAHDLGHPRPQSRVGRRSSVQERLPHTTGSAPSSISTRCAAVSSSWMLRFATATSHPRVSRSWSRCSAVSWATAAWILARPASSAQSPTHTTKTPTGTRKCCPSFPTSSAATAPTPPSDPPASSSLRPPSQQRQRSSRTGGGTCRRRQLLPSGSDPCGRTRAAEEPRFRLQRLVQAAEGGCACSHAFPRTHHARATRRPQTPVRCARPRGAAAHLGSSPVSTGGCPTGFGTKSTHRRRQAIAIRPLQLARKQRHARQSLCPLRLGRSAGTHHRC